MIDIERYTELIEEISDMQVAIKDRLNNIIKKHCETNPQKTLIEVDTAYEKIFCIGDRVSFHDLESVEHKLRLEWFLSPDLKELKEYFANYKRVNRLQQIDKCKEDIERYKTWILESEKTLKKLEEKEELL